LPLIPPLRSPVPMLAVVLLTAGFSLTPTPQQLPVAVTTSVKAVRNAASAYERLSKDQYLAVACIQSGILRSSSDMVAQSLRQVPELDFAHAAAMGTMGVLFSGLIGASWLRLLESKLVGSGTSLKKAAADFCLYAPFANSAYLICVPLLTALYTGGADMSALPATAFGTWEQGIVAVMMLELSLFAPYNVLSFRFIPPQLRPQTTSAMCAGFTVALSGFC